MFALILTLSLLQGTLSYVIGTGVQANPSGCNVCGETVGQWAGWTEWSSCSAAFGTPVETRTRICPSGNCPGGSGTESKPCVLYDPQPTQPQWGAWGAWSACSASCGGGTMTRSRVCNNGCSTCQCVGAAAESQACNAQPCCTWTAWSSWSACSVTCGSGGSITRTRQCSCGSGCTGGSTEQEPCPQQAACPCNTCYQPPTPCNTCNTPPPVVIVTTPAPCTTCYQPPAPSPCSTCGHAQPFYDPYGNGRKKRMIGASARNSTSTKV